MGLKIQIKFFESSFLIFSCQDHVNNLFKWYSTLLYQCIFTHYRRNFVLTCVHLAIHLSPEPEFDFSVTLWRKCCCCFASRKINLVMRKCIDWLRFGYLMYCQSPMYTIYLYPDTYNLRWQSIMWQCVMIGG